MSLHIYTVPQKMTTLYFFNNLDEIQLIWIILVHRILNKFHISKFEPVHHAWNMLLLYLAKLGSYYADWSYIAPSTGECLLNSQLFCHTKTCKNS